MYTDSMALIVILCTTYTNFCPYLIRDNTSRNKMESIECGSIRASVVPKSEGSLREVVSRESLSGGKVFMY